MLEWPWSSGSGLAPSVRAEHRGPGQGETLDIRKAHELHARSRDSTEEMSFGNGEAALDLLGVAGLVVSCGQASALSMVASLYKSQAWPMARY